MSSQGEIWGYKGSGCSRGQPGSFSGVRRCGQGAVMEGNDHVMMTIVRGVVS